jgi:hypothetical protein
MCWVFHIDVRRTNQRFYLDFWCLTPLSVISWSNIVFGSLVFNATFSYIINKDFIWIFGA